MPQLCGMILQDQPRPLRELRPDLPDGPQRVVLRCLEKNRDGRFGNIAELAAAITPFAPPSAQRSAERIARVLGASGVNSGPYSVPAASAAAPAPARTATGAHLKNRRRGAARCSCCSPPAPFAPAGAAFFVLRKPSASQPAPETWAARRSSPCRCWRLAVPRPRQRPRQRRLRP